MLRKLSKYFLLWFERCAPQAGGCCRDPIFHLHEFTCPPGTFLSEWFFCSVIYDGTDTGPRFPQRWQLERNTTLKTRCFHQKALSFFPFKLLILCAVWNPWVTFPDATGPMGTCAPLHLMLRWFLWIDRLHIALSLIPFQLYLYRTGNRISEHVSSTDKGDLQRADLHQTVDPNLRLYSIKLWKRRV